MVPISRRQIEQSSMSTDTRGTRRGPIVAKLTLAAVLTSVVPLVVAAYGLYEASASFPGTGLLLTACAACAVAGTTMLWRLVSATLTPARTARTPPAPMEAAGAISNESKLQPKPNTDDARHEVEALMDSLSRVLTTIEQQSAEINQYASRLDSAYREIETSSAQLKEFSFKDEVTGLYNRRFFSIRLEEEVSRYRRFDHPVSVVLMDLDRFKAVNDELGHGAGDETLRLRRDPLEALPRDQRHLPLWRGRIRGLAGRDVEGGGAPLCRPHSRRIAGSAVRPRSTGHRQLWHRITAGRRGSVAG